MTDETLKRTEQHDHPPCPICGRGQSGVHKKCQDRVKDRDA